MDEAIIQNANTRLRHDERIFEIDFTKKGPIR